MGFPEKIKTELTALVNAVPLNILVWGSGEGDVEHFSKRTKIRRQILTELPNSDVRFSEDLDLSEAIPGASHLAIHEQELWHLAACDLCVVLDTSKGAGEEIAHFVNSFYSHKLLILTHERYAHAHTFPASLRSHHNQIFYTAEEYATCNLVERVLARARIAALRKLGNFHG